MTITTGTHPKLLWPGLKKIWGDAYNDKPMMFSEVFDVQTSDKAYEETQELAGFGLAPVKAEGGSISYDTTINGYVTRFTNVTYGLGFIVTEEAVEDNQYKAQAEKRTKALKRSMRHTKETVFANILNRAFTAAYAGGDGKEMIATDHPTANGTQSNELTVAADLSETALEDLFIQMMNATDTRGLRIALMPKKLIVAPANAFNAERILKSTLQNDTANNAINAIRSKGLLTEGAISWAFLTDADAWFVKSDITDGLLAFNRRALDFQKDGDFETGNFKHKATERYSGGWDDWRGIWGSPGA
jgi:phage major head subunit gpT-like protein